ncbi:MAG: T9SS type A sorting domain-containing protein [Flavobacteriales bacterium]
MKPFICCLFFLLSTLVFGQNILVSSGTYFEGEPSIAINPSNPQHLIAAWMGFQFGQKIVIKSAYSINGGTSWSAPIFQAHLAAGNSSADVSLGFDHLGNAFMCYIDYDNVGFTQGKVVVRKTTDGGQTWGNAVEVINITDCPNKLCIDRPWMVVDQSGNAPLAPIYVTTMNADQPALITPPYNPYVSVSIDGGQSFINPRVIDTLNYLVGTSITQPMPTPTIDGTGKFYAVYPSYVVSQSVYPRQVLASSTNFGTTINHAIVYQGLNVGVSNSLFKRAGKLIADEAHPGHLAYCFLSEQNDQSDVYLMETSDGGNTWGSMQKVNQDPIGNNRVQDLLWGDFNASGDLVITWRDRRNASSDGYGQASEIYAATKPFGALTVGPDYPISSQAAAHDTILEGSGNDFMSVVYAGDTCYAVWGDVRSGTLKIYLNKWNALTHQNSISIISEEYGLLTYPNPTSNFLFFKHNFSHPIELRIVNSQGAEVYHTMKFTGNFIDVSSFSGAFFIEVNDQGKTIRGHFIRD